MDVGGTHDVSVRVAADEEFPSFLPDSILIMNLVAKAMIDSRYEAKSCMIYSGLRRKEFENELDKLGCYNLSMVVLEILGIN